MIALVVAATPSYSLAMRPARIFPRTSVAAMSTAAAAGIDLEKRLKRAEFWEEGDCSMLDLINVLGRWESCSEWCERTKFSVVENARQENMVQGASVERHDYARRNKMVERIALVFKAPELPFKDERLAAWAGKTIEEMDAMPVKREAIEILYDALTQSKSSLVPEKVMDERRSKLLTADGGFDEGAFNSGMAKSRLAVIVGFFLLGKGQLYGYVFVGRVVLDATGTFDLMKSFFGAATEPIFWALTIGAVFYTYQQDAKIKRETSDYEILTREEALEREKTIDKAVTVFEKMGR